MIKALLFSAASIFYSSIGMAHELDCVDRKEFLEIVSKETNASLFSAGVSTDGSMVETYVDHETGFWMSVATYTDMQTCLLDFGTSFQSIFSLEEGDPT